MSRDPRAGVVTPASGAVHLLVLHPALMALDRPSAAPLLATMTLALALIASLLIVTPASASCRPTSRAKLERKAEVVVKGTFAKGPDLGRVLLSPARLRKARYLKGRGPKRPLVTTSTRDVGDGFYQTTSDGIDPRAGERWLLIGDLSRDGRKILTGVCWGTKRLRR